MRENWSKLNKYRPHRVRTGSTKRIIFECDDCNHACVKMIRDMNGSFSCMYCKGTNKNPCDNLSCGRCSRYILGEGEVLCEDNENDPTKCSPKSHKFFVKRCLTCMHTYKQRAYSTKPVKTCPFCDNKRLCGDIECLFCLDKSCHVYRLIWSLDNTLAPHEVFKSSEKSIEFTCPKCPHRYWQTPHNKTGGSECCYCSHTILCGHIECDVCREKSCYSDDEYCNDERNNKKSHEVFARSNHKRTYECKHCTLVYKQTPNNRFTGCRCPMCRNKTESKLFTFLKSHGYIVNAQVRYEWCNNGTSIMLPFDFLVGANTIIELDGDQHFTQVSNWQSPDIIQTRDKHKMECALAKGFNIIRIMQVPVYKDINNWTQRLVDAIEKIKDLSSRIVYIDDDYHTYQRSYLNMEGFEVEFH